jgi:hypothetical protein
MHSQGHRQVLLSSILNRLYTVRDTVRFSSVASWINHIQSGPPSGSPSSILNTVDYIQSVIPSGVCPVASWIYSIMYFIVGNSARDLHRSILNRSCTYCRDTARDLFSSVLNRLYTVRDTTRGFSNILIRLYTVGDTVRGLLHPEKVMYSRGHSQRSTASYIDLVKSRTPSGVYCILNRSVTRHSVTF